MIQNIRMSDGPEGEIILTLDDGQKFKGKLDFGNIDYRDLKVVDKIIKSGWLTKQLESFEEIIESNE